MTTVINYHESSALASIIGRLEDAEQELIDLSESSENEFIAKDLERQSGYISKVIQSLTDIVNH